MGLSVKNPRKKPWWDRDENINRLSIGFIDNLINEAYTGDHRKNLKRTKFYRGLRKSVRQIIEVVDSNSEISELIFYKENPYMAGAALALVFSRKMPVFVEDFGPDGLDVWLENYMVMDRAAYDSCLRGEIERLNSMPGSNIISFAKKRPT